MNIPSWLVSNKTLWTRKCFIGFFLVYKFRHPCFQWPEIHLDYESSFSITHSYFTTESWTRNDGEFRTSISFLTWLLYMFNGVVLVQSRGNTAVSLLVSRSKFTERRIKISKRVGMLKGRRIKYQGVRIFFFFINQKFRYPLLLFLHILH